jgi:hypothetical protein
MIYARYFPGWSGSSNTLGSPSGKCSHNGKYGFCACAQVAAMASSTVDNNFFIFAFYKFYYSKGAKRLIHHLSNIIYYPSLIIACKINQLILIISYTNVADSFVFVTN